MSDPLEFYGRIGAALFPILPGSKNLTGANIELTNAPDRAIRLRQALAPVKDKYDVVILDCPPALDLLTVNVLVGSANSRDYGRLVAAGCVHRVARV